MGGYQTDFVHLDDISMNASYSATHGHRARNLNTTYSSRALRMRNGIFALNDCMPNVSCTFKSAPQFLVQPNHWSVNPETCLLLLHKMVFTGVEHPEYIYIFFLIFFQFRKHTQWSALSTGDCVFKTI